MRKTRRLLYSAAVAAVLGGATLVGVNLLGASAVAATDPGCTAQSAPSFTPDPILGSGADQYFGDASVATIPSTADTIGIPSPTSTTGTPSSPLTGNKFAAGYLDETELYEYLNNSTSGANPAGSPGAYDATQPPVLNNLPSGTVKHLDNTSSTGAGLPYAAILSSDLSHVIATVPVTITDETYTVDPTAWMPGSNRQPVSSCGGSGGAGDHYAALTFDASGVPGLSSGTTYAAYLLVRDTDVSGPLGNHIWYFTPPAEPKAFAGYADNAHPHHAGQATTPSIWQGSPGVVFEGCNYFTPSKCLKVPSGADRYDAGAIRLDNPSGSPMVVSDASVTIGSCTMHPWPGLNVSVPGNGQLILTQTGGPACGTGHNPTDFDTSDKRNGSKVNECTVNDGLMPVFHVTVNGNNLTYTDTSQILNTHGVDPGDQQCGLHNETEDWGAMSGP